MTRQRIAIVGLGGLFPEANGAEALWRNIAGGRDCTTAVPPGRWTEAAEKLLAAQVTPDKVLSIQGGFIADAVLRPLSGGVHRDIPDGLDPMFHILLQAGHAAWNDAVLSDTDRQRVGVILGNIALPTDASAALAADLIGSRVLARLGLPAAASEALPNRLNRYVAGLPAGLLARSLGLGGMVQTLDAACASSLYALKYAVDELQAGRADAMLCGGLSRPSSLYTQMGFSALGALSRSGCCRPFDRAADGLVVGEGAGVLVLKRVDDALAQGDRIYATIAGIGLANDIDGNLMSPASEGQLRAMRAAYRQAGWPTDAADLIECHGTGTPVGDAVEISSLIELRGDSQRPCVIGSVKSNIGHLLTAAGAAGLFKTLMAITYRQLPPTANFQATADGVRLEGSGVRILQQPEQWQVAAGQQRRAAVSAFGFGGINAHVLLEEWSEQQAHDRPAFCKAAHSEPVAVIGMAARRGTQNTTENGNSDAGLRPIESLQIPLGRYRIPPSELKQMLPQQLLMLQLADAALSDAGLEPQSLPREQTGVYIGIALDLNTTNFHLRWGIESQLDAALQQAGVRVDTSQYPGWLAQLREAVCPALNADRTMGALGGIVASRIARNLRTGGPAFTLSSEESSGLAAVQTAVRALQQQELDLAVAGAVDFATDERTQAGQDADACDAGGAVILKRLADAERDGDRILAVIDGQGAACGGRSDAMQCDTDDWQRSLQQSLEEAGIEAAAIGLYRLHGRSTATAQTLERDALRQVHADPAAALASISEDVGDCGAASGLLSLVAAIEALQQRRLPVRSLSTEPPADLEQVGGERPWLHDRAAGARRALVASHGVDGSCRHLLLSASAKAQPKSLPLPLALLLCHAADPEHLLLKLDALQAATQQTDRPLVQLAAAWAAQQRATAGDLCLALLADSVAQLQQRIERARGLLVAGESSHADGVYFSTEPLAGTGQLAFVFPGSGNHFHAMGRALALQWPAVLQRLEQDNEYLASQFAGGKFWRDQPARELSQSDVIFGQVWTGTLVSEVVSQFGLKPDAIIGYSLGETAGLFATRAWTDRDGMLRRIQESRLFTHDLAGPCEAARRCWGLAKGSAIDWRIGVVDRSASAVRACLPNHPRAYLLIINTPEECVIGGQAAAVAALVAELGCHFLPLNGVTTVHCEVAREVEQEYRELHLFDTRPAPGVRYYSGIRGGAYPVTRDSAADSIVGQAVAPFDFTQVIESAWQDGVRLFIEMGPGRSCTRMIDRILGERAHFAASVCAPQQDDVQAVFELLARLASEGVAIDVEALHPLSTVGDGQTQTAQPAKTLTIECGYRLGEIAPLPKATGSHQQRPLQESASSQPAPTLGPAAAAPDPVVNVTAPPASVDIAAQLHQAERIATAEAETQSLFLRVANGFGSSLGVAAQLQMHLLQQSEGLSEAVAAIAPAPVASGPKPLFDRNQCLQIATGSLGELLGPDFAVVDSFPTRVRLPDEPLMLVDRILSIDAEPLSMTAGSLVTEHDVLPAAWYLDGGRIPTCIAVEAGQADLFLSGYLGIDHLTRGLAVYRLLDARITFHGPLPQPGQTIRYEIHIDGFFRQGETHLFRFRFEGTVDGQPLLTMTEGCAGFFSAAELAAGKGIVQTGLELRPVPGERPADWSEPVPITATESYSERQLDCLRRGDLAGCFGPAFANLPLARPAGLPSGRMTLVHRILSLQANAGRYGIGEITGEADIHPQDWFLTCHFSDDQVMPGTLMYECCLHTLRIYLLRMGWVGEADDYVIEPCIGMVSQLKCRGQVTASTRTVQYRITLKTIGFEQDGTPFVIADALMFADGRPVVQVNAMSARLSGLTRAAIEALWAAREGMPATQAAPTVLFDSNSIRAFCEGKPSQAFGEPYRVFDSERRIARLPRDPYRFLDRITRIDGCQAFRLEAGGDIDAEYDVPLDAWYFADEAQPLMPFAVVLEVALQPCGWLAAYVGSALSSDTDLKFRNLGGSAVLHRPVTPDSGTLSTRVVMTGLSRSGGMIIQNFSMEVADHHGPVYAGDTYFGFFSEAALAEQVGIREAEPFVPDQASEARGSAFAYPSTPPYPQRRMRLLDEVSLFDAHGGPHGLGFIRGITHVDPEAWYYRAHFYQDPVCPGSLGVESLLQLLKVVAFERWPQLANEPTLRCCLAPDSRHQWTYRGQILPSDEQVTVELVVTDIDDAEHRITASGYLSVDGRVIYQLEDFTLALDLDETPAPAPAGVAAGL